MGAALEKPALLGIKCLEGLAVLNMRDLAVGAGLVLLLIEVAIG